MDEQEFMKRFPVKLKKVFLHKNGFLIVATFKTLNEKYGIKGISWNNMHTLHRQSTDSDVLKFLKKCGLLATIFHHDNLSYYGVTHLYPHEFLPLMDVLEVRE